MTEVFGLVDVSFAAAAIGGVSHAIRARVQIARLTLLATSDPLTGVANRARLFDRLEYELVRHSRHGERLALLVLDLDGFKLVNDSLGHPAGDRVLREVAARLVGAVRAQDTVARQGGDEFAVLAPRTCSAGAAQLAARIERTLEGVHSSGTAVGASVGWAVYPDDGSDLETLTSKADERQRRVKRARRP
jgi:diguanylate cyclase (GGDEF)-like protein